MTVFPSLLIHAGSTPAAAGHMHGFTGTTIDLVEERAAYMYGPQAQLDHAEGKTESPDAMSYARLNAFYQMVGEAAPQLDDDARWGRAQDYEHVHARVIMKPLATLGYNMIPVDNSVAPGAAKHTIRRINHKGKAKEWGQAGDNIPIVSVADEYNSYGTVHYVVGTLDQQFSREAEAYAGLNRKVEEQFAARRALDEIYNYGVWGFESYTPGRPAGVLNYPFISRETLTIDWSVDTGEQIAKKLYDWFQENNYRSLGTQKSDTIMMSQRVMGELASRFVGDDRDKTALDHLKGMLPGVAMEVAHELEEGNMDEGNWTKVAPSGMDIILKISRSAEGVRRVLTRGYTTAPPFQKQPFLWLNVHYMSAGGVIIEHLGTAGLGFVLRP